MCRFPLNENRTGVQESGNQPPLSFLPASGFEGWQDKIKLVGYGADTLVLNVRYCDPATLQPMQKELDEGLQQELDYLQHEARRAEIPVASDWDFQGTLLFVEPHGAGRQWRWLLTCRWLSLVVSPGKFNDVIAQVRFSSALLWREIWVGDALTKIHNLLMSIFGEFIHLQVSSLDLCADVTGYDFSLANYQQDFVTRSRKRTVIYAPEQVHLESCDVSYLRFSSSASPLSCRIYNKTQEIKQKSNKTWFYDLWQKGAPGPYGGSWDGSSEVWRIEFHIKREFFRNLKKPIEGAYDVLNDFRSLWMYAAGQSHADENGSFDGWLRYVMPTEDDNRGRWPLHPAWLVVQSAFAEDYEPGLGPVVRDRVRKENIERGLAAIIGYSSTLAAWLDGDYAAPSTDLSLTFRWLYEHGQKYLAEKKRDFFKEVQRKQQLYDSKDSDSEER